MLLKYSDFQAMYSTKIPFLLWCMLPQCNQCICDIQECQIMSTSSTCDPVSRFFVDEVQHFDVLQRMGGGSSTYAELPKNEHLNRLVSKVPLKITQR